MSRRPAGPTHLGVDGCRAGWIVAEGADLEAAPRFWLAPTTAALFEAAAAPDRVTCIDVPIGLPSGRRACDAEARAMLGGARAASVFTPPCRAALAGASRAEARALNVRASGGRSLSEQALGILPKIREVDAAMSPALQRRVKEVHPEVVFAAIAGRGVGAPKRSAEGRSARLALLPPAFARAAPAAASRPFPRAHVALDDYVDALAALLVAIRLARGEARRLPATGDERDERGLALEIWY